MASVGNPYHNSSVYCLFCVVLCIVCVYMCTELLPPGGYPIAVKYIISYIILPVVLYGCETWSLTLREERRLRVFENMVLGRIFGPKRDEVTGE